MSGQDLDTAQQFQSAAEDALRTGNFDPVLALLAPGVACVTPQHTLYGRDAIEAVAAELSRARPTEGFAVAFENGAWNDLGNGRYACEIRAHYRSKVVDELSYSRDRSFELTVDDGKVTRYEMRFAG